MTDKLDSLEEMKDSLALKLGELKQDAYRVEFDLYSSAEDYEQAEQAIDGVMLELESLISKIAQRHQQFKAAEEARERTAEAHERERDGLAAGAIAGADVPFGA